MKFLHQFLQWGELLLKNKFEVWPWNSGNSNGNYGALWNKFLKYREKFLKYSFYSASSNPAVMTSSHSNNGTGSILAFGQVLRIKIGFTSKTVTFTLNWQAVPISQMQEPVGFTRYASGYIKLVTVDPL